MIKLEDIEMSSSCANKALHEALDLKDWKLVRQIIREDMENVPTEDREEVFRLLQEKRLKTTMQIRPITAAEIVPTTSGKPGLTYLIRKGDTVSTGRFYKARKGEIEFIDNGGFIPVNKIDEIFEITFSTDHKNEQSKV